MLQKISSFIVKGFLFITCLFLVVGNEKILFADTDLPVTQFVEESGTAWNNLADAYYKGLSMRMIFTTPKESTLKADVCLLGKNELGLVHPTKDMGGMFELDVINSRYAFRLDKNTEETPWNLVNMWDNPNTVREDTQFNHGLLQPTAYIFEPIMIESSWLKDLMTSKEMEVISLKEQHVGDENYVEMQFRCQQYNVDKYVKLLGGTILFNKKYYFVIKEYNVQTEFVADGMLLKNGEKNSGSIVSKIEKKLEYQVMNSIPYLKTSRTTHDVLKSTLKVDIFHLPDNNFMNIDYEIIDSNKVNNELFFLKYYGFSEPSDPVRRGNVIRIILIVTGILLIIIGLYFRYRASQIRQ
jgi:hypothetical protein